MDMGETHPLGHYCPHSAHEDKKAEGAVSEATLTASRAWPSDSLFLAEPPALSWQWTFTSATRM